MTDMAEQADIVLLAAFVFEQEVLFCNIYVFSCIELFIKGG